MEPPVRFHRGQCRVTLAWFCAPCALDALSRFQGMLEVGQEVAPVLDADRDADEAVGHAGVGKFLFGETGMRGGFRMACECFDTAKRNRVSRDLQTAQEIERRRFPP